MQINLKNYLGWGPQDSIEAYTIAVTLKVIAYPTTGYTTLLEMKGKERIMLQINNIGRLRVSYELADNTFGFYEGGILALNVLNTVAFGVLRNKIDPVKSAVFLHSTVDGMSSKLKGNIVSSNFLVLFY